MTVEPSRRIRQSLKDVWPELQFIWLFDRRYICPTHDELIKVIDKVWTRQKSRGELVDCDEQALFLHSDVKKHLAKTDTDYTWAFGEVALTMSNGWPGPHSQNICVTKEGIYLIEPQTKEIWKAHKRDDEPYWVRM
jgi:hypothetical protein